MLFDSTKRSIAEAVNRIEPFVDLEITYVAIPDTEKYVIVIFVEEQRFMRPFTYKGRAYQRIESTTSAEGNIYELLDAAMAFFFKHLSLSGKINGLYREEELSIPYKALRESCINSFCHRSYHHPGIRKSIRMVILYGSFLNIIEAVW